MNGDSAACLFLCLPPASEQCVCVCVCVRAHIDAFQSDSVGVSHSV